MMLMVMIMYGLCSNHYLHIVLQYYYFSYREHYEQQTKNRTETNTSNSRGMENA
jgi:hypothetical protein